MRASRPSLPNREDLNVVTSSGVAETYGHTAGERQAVSIGFAEAAE
jgi:hypothetical protein